jgi:transcriptional regulator with XRE-family HTH domain
MTTLPPREAAERLLAARQDQSDWLDDFAEHLDRRRSGQSLERTLAVWDLSQSDAARLFGVSRQALGKWLHQGVPADRAEVIANLAAATDLLLHHLKRDRIPAVVRRTAANLDDRSLLDLLAQEQSAALLQACRQMFDFASAQA